MGRWEPDARSRLEAAGLELYVERGFEGTTVADIAERAGLTERTFFRHFSDKREVLFDREGHLQVAFVGALAAAPAAADPMAALELALDAGCVMLNDRRDRARLRQGVIDANPALQERELLKLATITAALASGLGDRGVPSVAASLAAEAVMGAFRVAFVRWIAPDETRDFPTVGRETLAELRTVLG